MLTGKGGHEASLLPQHLPGAWQWSLWTTSCTAGLLTLKPRLQQITLTLLLWTQADLAGGNLGDCAAGLRCKVLTFRLLSVSNKRHLAPLVTTRRSQAHSVVQLARTAQTDLCRMPPFPDSVSPPAKLCKHLSYAPCLPHHSCGPAKCHPQA